MLGDLITKALVLLLGYTIPAFECFKIVEKNKADIEELRFWCQYWIILAILTVFERLGDVFISWLPMYGEAKLAFIVYLWYPKTRGTSYVYETFLRPYVARRETDIDRRLLEVRARALDMAVLYWRNIAEQGQTKFFEALRYLASQSSRLPSASSKKFEVKNPATEPLPRRQSPPPSRRQSPPPRLSSKRTEFQSPKANHVYEAPAETGTVEEHIGLFPRWGQDTAPGLPISPRSTPTTGGKLGKHMKEDASETIHTARQRFWQARRPD